MLAFRRHLDTLLYTCGTTRSRVYCTALVMGLAVLYAGVFWVLHPRYGDALVSLLVFPLIAAAGLFGMWAGLAVWTLGLPFQALLYGLCCAIPWSVIVDRGIVLGFVALLPVVVVVGRQRDLGRQMNRELDRRRSAEAELREKQQNLPAAVQTRQQLEQALAKQNEVNQIKNRFMTTISHEFRTPFAIILSSAELLERYFERLTAERRVEALLSIKLQIQHLRDMLDDISVILRQEESPPPFRPAATNAVELVSQIIDKAAVSVAEAHHLRFESQGDLAAVMLDPNLVTTIVRNLLSNAIKFSPAGSEIRLSLSRGAHEVVLRVSDDGIGIPQDEQTLIFETFYRARNASHIPGMGLGLSVVRDYVNIHMGRVEVESTEGEGATFTVWLPCELTGGA